MTLRIAFAAALAFGMIAMPAHADPGRAAAETRIPRQLDDAAAARFRSIFAAIRDARWAEAQAALAAAPADALLTSIAMAELYTAKGSPRVEIADLQALLSRAPELPQAPQLARLAALRGSVTDFALPVPQALVWNDGAPARLRAASTRADLAAVAFAVRMAPLVKDDRAAEAEIALGEVAATLSAPALTEWRAKIAWIYYLTGDDANARRIATVAALDAGDWALQARWTQGLAAWRGGDCVAAATAFDDVGRRAGDVDLRAAGLYWAARADMRCARPQAVQARLRAAALFDETFYGQLAAEALSIADTGPGAAPVVWAALEKQRNVRVAAALTEIGESRLAEEVLRHQARIGDRNTHVALVQLAGRLNLPTAQLWLCHNAPRGIATPKVAHYPMPDWQPEGGLRVDKALLFAHALQESRFRADVVSPAGAYGLMQIMPAAATDYARRTGAVADRGALTRPSFNMAVGQSHLETLSSRASTGGLLPKVIAAYNAGLVPLEQWNQTSRDRGDPLLYIESIPYWETRGYVTTVLRNYWMYQQQAGSRTASRAALVEGLWPRFPGLAGKTAVRIDSGRSVASAD